MFCGVSTHKAFSTYFNSVCNASFTHWIQLSIALSSPFSPFHFILTWTACSHFRYIFNVFPLSMIHHHHRNIRFEFSSEFGMHSSIELDMPNIRQASQVSHSVNKIVFGYFSPFIPFAFIIFDIVCFCSVFGWITASGYILFDASAFRLTIFTMYNIFHYHIFRINSNLPCIQVTTIQVPSEWPLLVWDNKILLLLLLLFFFLLNTIKCAIFIAFYCDNIIVMRATIVIVLLFKMMIIPLRKDQKEIEKEKGITRWKQEKKIQPTQKYRAKIPRNPYRLPWLPRDGR